MWSAAAKSKTASVGTLLRITEIHTFLSSELSPPSGWYYVLQKRFLIESGFYSLMVIIVPFVDSLIPTGR